MRFSGSLGRLWSFSSLGLACLLSLSWLPGALARNVWDINHGMSNPPIPSSMQPGAQQGQPGQPGAYGTINQGKPFDPNFWQHLMENRIPAGTVLSAILENDL